MWRQPITPPRRVGESSAPVAKLALATRLRPPASEKRRGKSAQMGLTANPDPAIGPAASEDRRANDSLARQHGARVARSDSTASCLMPQAKQPAGHENRLLPCPAQQPCPESSIRRSSSCPGMELVDGKAQRSIRSRAWGLRTVSVCLPSGPDGHCEMKGLEDVDVHECLRLWSPGAVGRMQWLPPLLYR